MTQVNGTEKKDPMVRRHDWINGPEPENNLARAAWLVAKKSSEDHSAAQLRKERAAASAILPPLEKEQRIIRTYRSPVEGRAS